MTRVIWDAVGTRTYETGLDRGMLYVDGREGVAWSGLVSVSEKPSGGESVPSYYDGVKTFNRAAKTEYEATIQAITYPDFFIECEGSAYMASGLIISDQTPKSFGMGYRTKIGNDINADLGYKLHVVYGCLIVPSERDRASLSDSPTPLNFSWEVTTTPIKIPGYKPTSHFILDTRYIAAGIMDIVEGIIYGTTTSAPRIPTVDELINLGLVLGGPPVGPVAPAGPLVILDGGTA